MKSNLSSIPETQDSDGKHYHVTSTSSIRTLPPGSTSGIDRAAPGKGERERKTDYPDENQYLPNVLSSSFISTSASIQENGQLASLLSMSTAVWNDKGWMRGQGGTGKFVPVENRPSTEGTSNTPLIARSCDMALIPECHRLHFTFDDFEFDKVLGTGASGICVSAVERRSSYPVVVKIISKFRFIRTETERDLEKEVELHSHLKHPCIVPLYTWIHNRFVVGLVMKLCNVGDLFNKLDRMKDANAHTEAQTSRIMFDVLWAMRFCHAHNIAHLDLKPENCMIHKDRNEERIHLGDFGMSERLLQGSEEPSKKRGTYDYFSPEQTAKNNQFGPYNHKADLWTVGVLAYEVYYSRPPFGSTLDAGGSQQSVLQSIREDLWYKRMFDHNKYKAVSGEREYSQVISTHFKSFLSACLQKNSTMRPTAEDLFDHEFIRLHNHDRLTDTRFKMEPYKRNTGFNRKD